jgi:hypothetical protein
MAYPPQLISLGLGPFFKFLFSLFKFPLGSIYHAKKLGRGRTPSINKAVARNDNISNDITILFKSFIAILFALFPYLVTDSSTLKVMFLAHTLKFYVLDLVSTTRRIL